MKSVPSSPKSSCPSPGRLQLTPGAFSGTSYLRAFNATVTQEPLKKDRKPHNRRDRGRGLLSFETGQAIPGAKSSSIVLANVSLPDEGEYSVEVTNAVNKLVSAGATLKLSTRFESPVVSANGDFQVEIAGSVGWTVLVQSSTNMTSWTTITNLVLTGNRIRFIDTETPGHLSRFYRILVNRP